MKGHRDQENGCCSAGKRGQWCLARVLKWRWKEMDGLGKHFGRKVDRTC